MTATTDRAAMIAMMERMHAEGCGCYTVTIINRDGAAELAVEGMRGDVFARRMLFAVRGALRVITERYEAGNPDMCLLCEHRFASDEDMPEALVIMAASVDKPLGAMVTGLCEGCFEAHADSDMEAVVMAEFRKMMPDMRVLPAQHAPGHA